MPKNPCVYMLASQPNGTLYTGVTADLELRISAHRQKHVPGFTERYGVTLLVWYESHETMPAAIAREKAIKKWRRGWKVALIEEHNPDWRDIATHSD